MSIREYKVYLSALDILYLCFQVGSFIILGQWFSNLLASGPLTHIYWGPVAYMDYIG